jgi:hypothetical protein
MRLKVNSLKMGITAANSIRAFRPAGMPEHASKVAERLNRLQGALHGPAPNGQEKAVRKNVGCLHQLAVVTALAWLTGKRTLHFAI